MKPKTFQYFLDFNIFSCMDTVKKYRFNSTRSDKKKQFKTHFSCFLFYHTQRANLKHFLTEVV